MKELRFELVDEISEKVLGDIAELEAAMFEEPYTPERLKRELGLKSRICLILAYDGERPVAFKAGFDRSADIFYSWIGGVLPEYRGRGIARELMRRQHEWCRESGFSKVQTVSDNRFREMMIINLWDGFDITGTYVSGRSGKLKVTFEKNLMATEE